MDGCRRIDGGRCGLRGMARIELTHPSIFAGRWEGARPSMPRGEAGNRRNPMKNGENWTVSQGPICFSRWFKRKIEKQMLRDTIPRKPLLPTADHAYRSAGWRACDAYGQERGRGKEGMGQDGDAGSRPSDSRLRLFLILSHSLPSEKSQGRFMQQESRSAQRDWLRPGTCPCVAA